MAAARLQIGVVPPLQLASSCSPHRCTLRCCPPRRCPPPPTSRSVPLLLLLPPTKPAAGAAGAGAAVSPPRCQGSAARGATTAGGCHHRSSLAAAALLRFRRAHQPSLCWPHSVISSQPAVFASSVMSEHPSLMLSSSSRELLERAEAELRPVSYGRGHAGAELGLLEHAHASTAKPDHALYSEYP